ADPAGDGRVGRARHRRAHPHGGGGRAACDRPGSAAHQRERRARHLARQRRRRGAVGRRSRQGALPRETGRKKPRLCRKSRFPRRPWRSTLALTREPRLRKNYVLDTNVLLHDPRALFQFKDNNVIIPIYVVEEIDKFKRDLSELGRNARQVSRDLDAFREENGSLTEGVPLESGGTLRVLFTERELPRELMNQHIADNRILALAMDVK